MGNQVVRPIASKQKLGLRGYKLGEGSTPLLVDARSFNFKKDYEQAVKIANKLQRRREPGMLRLLSFTAFQDESCEKQYRIQYFYQYAEMDLSERTAIRNNQGRYFLESELLDLLQNVSTALQCLRTQGRSHGAVSAYSVLYCGEAPKLIPPELLEKRGSLGSAVPQQRELVDQLVSADLFRLGVLVHSSLMVGVRNKSISLEQYSAGLMDLLSRLMAHSGRIGLSQLRNRVVGLRREEGKACISQIESKVQGLLEADFQLTN